MKILIISTQSLGDWNEKNGTDLGHEELTDEQFKTINEEFENGWHFDSYEELIDAMNRDADTAPTSNCHCIRVIKDPETFFPITSVHRDDLEAQGFDTRDVSDSTMRTLAEKMADAYIPNGFWTDLDIIASELGIPRKASVETMRKARALWEQYDHESEWTPSETPGKQDVYLKVTENGERYFFEGEGKSDDGIQTIVSLTCRCPDGTIAKLF